MMKISAFARPLADGTIHGYALHDSPSAIRAWIASLTRQASPEITKSGRTFYFNCGPHAWAMSFERETEAEEVFRARAGSRPATFINVPMVLD